MDALRPAVQPFNVQPLQIIVHDVRENQMPIPPVLFRTQCFSLQLTNDRIQSALEERKRAVYTRQHETWALPIYGNFSEREKLM